MADRPHFPASDFRFVNGKAKVVEQDSLADKANRVWAILAYPLGSRPEARSFGIDEQAFVADAATNLTEIRAAIAASDPGIDDYEVGITDEQLLRLVRHARAEVRGVR